MSQAYPNDRRVRVRASVVPASDPRHSQKVETTVPGYILRASSGVDNYSLRHMITWTEHDTRQTRKDICDTEYALQAKTRHGSQREADLIEKLDVLYETCKDQVDIHKRLMDLEKELSTTILGNENEWLSWAFAGHNPYYWAGQGEDIVLEVLDENAVVTW